MKLLEADALLSGQVISLDAVLVGTERGWTIYSNDDVIFYDVTVE